MDGEIELVGEKFGTFLLKGLFGFIESYGRHGWFKVYIHSRHWHYSTFLSGAGIFPENAVNM